MKSKNSITELCQAISRFCNEFNQRPPLRASSAYATAVRKDLTELGARIDQHPAIRSRLGDKYAIFVSRGAGTFPKVPWVAIAPKGKKVSTSISTAICFARDGKGLVAGLMAPLNSGKGGYVLVNRTKQEKFLDVNGSGTSTKYNNKFILPKDFFLEQFSEREFLAHLENSIKEMNLHLSKQDA